MNQTQRLPVFHFASSHEEMEMSRSSQYLVAGQLAASPAPAAAQKPQGWDHRHLLSRPEQLFKKSPNDPTALP